MNILELCFTSFADQQGDGFIEFSIGGIEKKYRRWSPTPSSLSIAAVTMMTEATASTEAAYFGPAVRKASNKMGKKNCLGSAVCWVDCDYEEEPICVFPPTARIWSGHGWHLYWKTTEFQSGQSGCREVELANQGLAHSLKGDSCHNIDRMMRLPGTMNTYREPHQLCKLIEIEPTRSYDIDNLQRLAGLDIKIFPKILLGDRRGYKSRSERDFAIIRALVDVGFDDAIIYQIFQIHKCGDKFRAVKQGEGGDKYLEHSIKNARSGVGTDADAGNAGSPTIKGPQLIELNHCYYLRGRHGLQQVSTFTLAPKLLLEGSDRPGNAGADSIVCDVQAAGVDFTWENVIWPRSAFDGMRSLNRQLRKASWVWLGRDADVRTLLAHLVNQIIKAGVPRARAVTSLGRHRISNDDRDFFVANNCILASDGSVWLDPSESPVMYVPPGREAPIVHLANGIDAEAGSFTFDTEMARSLSILLPSLNEPECIWPLVGWFMATPFKPAIEALQYRFPIMNVTGTRGSGKSTLIMNVFQALLGYDEPRSYNSDTTRFVTLSLLGSTNAVPIAFSEFRAAMSTDFLRYILLAYDTGRDARGRPDQTTVEYPLVAPFTLDGEDQVDDAAALERIIAVVLSPLTIGEGEPAWQAFQDLQSQVNLKLFALPYIRHTLEADVPALLDRAEQDVYEAFEMKLPSRVRRNLTICWLGVLSFMSFMETYGVRCFPQQGAGILSRSLENVYSASLGRAPTAADSFVEFVINTAAQKTYGARSFPWVLEKGILWFQLTPAFELYLRQRISQRRQASTLSRNAIRLQLKELMVDYMVAPTIKTLKGRKVMAFGVSLERASTAGLDSPTTFKSSTMTIDF